MPFPPSPLLGKTALVTGVSRRKGIGFAVARRFAELGANVFIQHFSPHDAEQPWGSDDLDEVRAGITSAQIEDATFGDVSLDLAVPDSASALMKAACGLTGGVDILVCNHARSGSDGTINPGPVNTGYLDPETTDRPLEEIQESMRNTPFGRFGYPADPARLIGWLATDEGRWIVGQVLTTDGGFAL